MASLDGPVKSVVYMRERCPHREDGGHELRDQGYRPELFAHLYRCRCGLESFGKTDEHRYRLGYRVDRAEPAETT